MALHTINVNTIHLFISWKSYEHPISKLFCQTPTKTTLSACKKSGNAFTLYKLSVDHTNIMDAFSNAKFYQSRLTTFLQVHGFNVVQDSILTENDGFDQEIWNIINNK
jgi:hypothetical protein